MRKVLHILGFLALLAAGISCNKEIPGQAGNEIAGQTGKDGMCTVIFRLSLGGMNSKAVTTGTVAEGAIARVDVFEYDVLTSNPLPSNHFVLTEDELDAAEFHLQYQYGSAYTYLVLANLPEAIAEDFEVRRLSYIKNAHYQWSDLFDGTHFPDRKSVV